MAPLPRPLGLHRRKPSAWSSRPGLGTQVFLIDLDNTLHDASWRIMTGINRGMTQAIMQALGLEESEASALRTHYWRRYGATLLGLTRHHPTVCPRRFLRDSHDLSQIQESFRSRPGLAHRLRQLPGRHWLLTNAPHHYTWACLRLLRLHRHFERVITVEDMRAHGRFQPKPSRLLWASLRRQAAGLGCRATLIDDDTDNLRAAHRSGLRTARIWASPTVRSRSPLHRPARPVSATHQVNSLEALLRRPGLHPRKPHHGH